jgi:chemotaxis protein CheX
MAIELRPQDLEQVVESVFSTMMGFDVTPAMHAGIAPVPSGTITAGVRLLGAGNAAVLVDCLPRQACRFAGSYLGMPPPDAVNGDVRDVLGEVANMIAGNLKCTLEPGIRLSLPFVGQSAAAIQGSPAFQSAFETKHGPFWLTVLKGP